MSSAPQLDASSPEARGPDGLLLVVEGIPCAGERGRGRRGLLVGAHLGLARETSRNVFEVEESREMSHWDYRDAAWSMRLCGRSWESRCALIVVLKYVEVRA